MNLTLNAFRTILAQEGRKSDIVYVQIGATLYQVDSIRSRVIRNEEGLPLSVTLVKVDQKNPLEAPI